MAARQCPSTWARWGCLSATMSSATMRHRVSVLSIADVTLGPLPTPTLP